MNKQLADKLKTLPKTPGVYFHKSAAGEIIYVGKAAVLKNRVRQYFQKSRLRDAKTDALVAEIAMTDWMEVESELEALFLEAEMIRRYMPRYNILLRDDKSLSYIRIDIQSDYPTVTTTHHPLDDGAEYFGPYFSLYSIRQALKLLRRIFPFATNRQTGQKRATLHYHLGLDPGLESGKTSLAEYRASLRRLIAVIKGKKQTILKELERDMHRAAKEHRFEDAARIRNQLRHLQELGRQVIFSDKEFLDISKDQALVQLQELLSLKQPPRRIEGFDVSHMSGTHVVASMVTFVNGVSKRDEYRKFKLTKQQNDDYASMHEVLQRRFSEKNRKAWGLPDIVLVDGGIGQLGSAIGAIRANNTSVAVIGLAKREEELLVHAVESGVDSSFLESLIHQPRPGVSVVRRGDIYALNLHVGQMNAGSHSKNLRGGSSISPYTDTVKLLQRIRDESHRFAVSYHSTLKRSNQTKSILDEIPGIGPASRKKLLRAFGSVRVVMAASQNDLQHVMGQKTGAMLYEWFHSSQKPASLLH
ncbi:MAG TPA: excinuclease ABC subunit UvrC [Candidatus Saccharibacteria bacterium]|nr:excinuclease ABC subunit UvrC [Candidatus Saccharibacteria bacterium]